jgi:hypothetical protein
VSVINELWGIAWTLLVTGFKLLAIMGLVYLVLVGLGTVLKGDGK